MSTLEEDYEEVWKGIEHSSWERCAWFNWSRRPSGIEEVCADYSGNRATEMVAGSQWVLVSSTVSGSRRGLELVDFQLRMRVEGPLFQVLQVCLSDSHIAHMGAEGRSIHMRKGEASGGHGR